MTVGELVNAKSTPWIAGRHSLYLARRLTDVRTGGYSVGDNTFNIPPLGHLGRVLELVFEVGKLPGAHKHPVSFIITIDIALKGIMMELAVVSRSVDRSL